MTFTIAQKPIRRFTDKDPAATAPSQANEQKNNEPNDSKSQTRDQNFEQEFDGDIDHVSWAFMHLFEEEREF